MRAIFGIKLLCAISRQGGPGGGVDQMKNTLVAMIKFEVEGGGGGGGDGGNKPPLSPIGFIDTSKCDEIGKSIKITPVSSFFKKTIPIRAQTTLEGIV